MRSFRLSLPAVMLALAACATQPVPGSLTAVHQQARQEMWESCLKTQFSVNRHVPVLSLASHCDQLVRLRYGPTGR